MLSCFEISAWPSRLPLLLKHCTKLHPFWNLISKVQLQIFHLRINSQREQNYEEPSSETAGKSAAERLQLPSWFVNNRNAKQTLIYWYAVNFWLMYQPRHSPAQKTLEKESEVTAQAAPPFHCTVRDSTPSLANAHQTLQKALPTSICLSQSGQTTGIRTELKSLVTSPWVWVIHDIWLTREGRRVLWYSAGKRELRLQSPRSPECFRPNSSTQLRSANRGVSVIEANQTPRCASSEDLRGFSTISSEFVIYRNVSKLPTQPLWLRSEPIPCTPRAPVHSVVSSKREPCPLAARQGHQSWSYSLN